MAKWKRSGLDAIREYEASSSYAKNIGAAQVAQQDRPNEKKWKRSGLDAIREYEASSNFPKTVAVRKYNAADREYNPSGTPALQKPKSQQHAQAAQEQRQKEQRRRNQLAVAAAAGAQADALQQSYYSYKQAGAPQAAQDAAYQNYAWARHQQDELNRANAMGRQLDPKEMQRLTTVRYRSPAQAAAQETAKNTPAAKNREWADERTKKRQEQLSEQEFNRSSAMQKQYGSYNNYLRGVYAGYDEAVAKREAEQAKTSEDLRAESDALQTQIDELSDKLKTAYQNPSSENYKNFMELQQQWKETRKRKKEVDKRVSEKQTEERRAEQQAAQEAAQGKYGGWSEERMQGRLDELNRQINLALARSDGTADVSALKTEREALEEEKRRAYPTAGQKALNYLEDANDALMLAGTAQAMTGYEQTHAFAEAAANRAAAWALRDIANSAILRELGGEKYAEKLRSLADKMAVDVDYTGAQQWQEEYQRIMDEATKDHSGAGKWILEQLPSAGAMVVDMGMAGLFGVNAGTGAMNVTPLTMMGIRAGGSAALDAKNEGATDAQAALIGLENAAVEIFSEKLFGGNPLYDEDVGLVNKAVSKLTNSKTVMKVLDSKAFDFVSEGFEEVVAELLEPTFQSMVLHGTLDGATNAENIGNAFLGGVFLAALGKVAGAPAGLTQAQNERKAQQYAQVMSRIGMQSENAEVRAAAEAMQEKLDYGRTPDEADFGRLVNAMDAAGDMGAATEAVENAQQERQNRPETLGHYETMLVQAGIGVESAKSRVDVMERLVRGETVSDAELKKIQMGSKLSKQMLYEMSGVEIPEGITHDRDLMSYYRMAYESAQERASGESVRTAAQEAEQTTPEEQSVPAENTETPQAAGAPDEQKKTPKKPEVRAPEQRLQDARAMRDGGAAEADVLAQTGWIPLSSDSYLNPKTGEQVYFDGETVTVWQNGRGAQNAAQSNADAPVQEAENVQQAEAYAQETQGAASAENTANGQTAQEAPKSENSKPGLTMDEYVQTMLDNETAGKIDTVAKALGVNVRFVDAVEGGRANAQISGRQVLVEKNNRNPVMFLLGHEWTHRMQDAAPEQYRTFREAIMDEIRPQAQAVMENYARQGYEITEEAALDEAAADYAGRMIDDGTVLDEFIEKHRDDRTLLQKIADAIREMIRKLTGAERKKAETAEGKLLAAMDAAAENTKNAASDGITQFSIKETESGKKYVLVDQQQGRFIGLNSKEAAKLAKEIIQEEFSGQTLPLGEYAATTVRRQDGWSAHQSGDRYDGASKYAYDGRQYSDTVFQAKMRAAANLDEMLKASEYVGHSNDRKNHTFATDGFDYYKTTFIVGGRAFDGTFNIGLSDMGATFYGMTKIEQVAVTGTLASALVTDAQPDYGDLRNSRVAQDSENVNRKFSLKETTAEERKQHDNDALSYFDKTYKWSETGYVLLDGSKLDFSGRHEGGPGGYRTVDHRDIVDALGEDYGGGDYSGGMVQFMQEGNIRISPESGGINLAVMPTKAQMDSLSDFISKERGAVILGIDDANGNTISSTEYPRGTHANRVLQDIRNYFNAGITPEVSSTPTVSQFRDSLKGAEVSREYADVLKENELLKERVDYWKGQTKRTDRATTNEKSVSREATSLVKRYGAELDASDIQGDLQSLYDAMANGELDGKEAFSQAKEIAGKLVENAVEADDELYQSYKDLRNFLRTTKLTISEEDGKNIPDLTELRKQNFGRMTIGKGQTNIDQVYQELADQWPEFFDEDAVSHPADQLQQIADVLGNIYTITEQNPYQGYMEQAKTAAANEILDDFFEIPQTRKTFADRQAAALSEAKAKGKAQAQKVREQKNAQLADLREKNRARVNSILEKERTRRADQINKLKEQYKSRDTAAKDRREARELRNKIIRHTKGLSQKLLRPTDKQHIPEILKHEVAAMLESINMEDNYTLDPATIREGKVGKDGKTTLYGEKLRGADRNERGVMTRRSEAFAALKAKYTQIVKDGDAMIVDPYLLGNNSEGIRGGFDEVIGMKDTPLADLSKSQLQTMWNVVRAVEHSVSTYGKMLSNVKFTETQNWADALKRDTESRRERTGGLLLDFETPYTFFSHYGDAGTSIYRMLRDAQDRQQLMVNDVTEQTRKIVDPKTVKEMEKQTHTFKLASGKELTLTTAQVMDLYNLMQRKQAHDHLIKGGVMQPEIKDRKIRRGTESLRLTEADLVNIAGSLTEEQTKIAQGLQKLTSGVLADYGNEASMRAYGYKKFTEQNYWPIKSAKEGIYSNVEKGGNQDRSIKNIGMAKQTTPEAGNALEISSIFDTFSNHASDMTDYAAWLCAMEDANRLFNFRFKDGAGNLTGETIRGLLEKYGGKGAQSYWTKLMSDIQNGINTKEFTPATQAATKLIGGFKGAAVGGNIRVVIQQPTAFFRASAVLSPLDMARGLAGGVTKGGGWKRALEYSPIAMRKGNGSFDISAPYTMKQTLFDNRDAIRKVNDFLSAPAGAADAVTWGRLWNACEWAVKRGYPNLKPGSKAFYEQTARQFAEVIDQTQVVDGVLQRSNIMRAKNEITKQATSFKGEPIMSINLLVRTIDAFTHETSKEKKSSAAKKIGRAAAALLVTDVVNAFAQSIIDGIRDDDKDKKWWKRVMSAFTGQTGEEETAWEKGWNFVMEGNLGGNLNKAASMPYLADVFSLMQGYEVARTDTEVINDIVRASQTLIKSLGDDGKKTWVYATKATLGATAKLFGLPLNNLTRDLWGVLRSVAIETDNIPLQYEMEKMIWDIDNHSNSGKFGELLYKSLTLGDTEAYQKIRGEMQKRMGLDDSRIKSILRGHVKDDYTGGKMTQDEAITFLVKHGIEKDKDAAFWKIQGWDSGDEEDYTKFGELSDAVLNGGKSSTGATVDELVEWYVEHGTKRSAVQSGITSAVHEAYKDGTIDEETVANLLKQYQVYDEGEKGYQTDDDIYWTVREWTAQYNGDEDYHKYDSVYEVVENGGNLKDVIREYTENGTEEKTIASALTSHYKPLYIAASASERKKMKEYLVKAYAALGRDKEKARKDIDKWLEE